MCDFLNKKIEACTITILEELVFERKLYKSEIENNIDYEFIIDSG